MLKKTLLTMLAMIQLNQFCGAMGESSSSQSDEYWLKEIGKEIKMPNKKVLAGFFLSAGLGEFYKKAKVEKCFANKKVFICEILSGKYDLLMDFVEALKKEQVDGDLILQSVRMIEQAFDAVMEKVVLSVDPTYIDQFHGIRRVYARMAEELFYKILIAKPHLATIQLLGEVEKLRYALRKDDFALDPSFVRYMKTGNDGRYNSDGTLRQW
jgi:hypothetical protein